jgi:hypothetical protein
MPFLDDHYLFCNARRVGKGRREKKSGLQCCMYHNVEFLLQLKLYKKIYPKHYQFILYVY